MYLVIGGNGYLGSYVIKNILEYTTDEVIATARDIGDCNSTDRLHWISCEIMSDDDIKKLGELTSGTKDVKVVYLAAYHKPDLVQKNPRLAWNINITSLSKIINMLENVRCFFYASTDSVYGNSIDNYHFKEEDRLNPENIYGKQKQTAESVVLGYGYNVVRYPFLIGPSLLNHKKHFYDNILETIKKGQPFDMFKDSYRSSLDFNTAACILVRLMETYTKDIPKILNISGDQDLSKYDVGLMIASSQKCDQLLIRPISIKGNDMIFDAPRATSTLLDNSCVKKVLGVQSIRISL